MRWLPHRGGALDFRDHSHRPSRRAVSGGGGAGRRSGDAAGRGHAGADSLSEYQFAGLLRGSRTEVAPALGVPLRVPAYAEIVEGHTPDPAHASGYEHALEGPYGDHTGYYNEQASFPVLTVDRITHAARSDLPLHPTPASRPTSRACWAWR